MQILIVDDDVVDRENVKRSLFKSAVKCSIEEAVDVDTALAMCNEKQFDVVLLDYRLPKRDGIELLLELRSKSDICSEVVVMMSNSEDEALALECLQAGAQDFVLKKEITAAKLRRTILQAGKRFELELELRESFQRVKRLAERDVLTNLANRYLFDETFKLAVANHQRKSSKLALLLFDVDNFKLINDSFGHSAGDALLQGICKRIATVLRDDEMFARLGGDEFAILLTNLASPYDAARLAERVRLSLNTPFTLEGHEVSASVSIGIAVYQAEGGNSTEELLRYADIAMYRSKRKGRGQISFFEQGMQDHIERRLTLENGLAQALQKREFFLCYQPMFNVQSKALEGFEALIRWQSAQGLIMPDEFIPVSEQSHQIIGIGRWVLSEAVRQLGLWNRGRSIPLRMAINISANQLADTDLPSITKALCAEHHIEPDLLEFELTETALLDNSSVRVATLEALVGLGCSLALDDFGTGYSSIAHLQNTPLSTVKLDRSMMPSADEAGKSTALLNGLVAMLKELNLSIVAEGVETRAHEQLCQTLGVHRLQGFYYCEGVSAQNITQRYLGKKGK